VKHGVEAQLRITHRILRGPAQSVNDDPAVGSRSSRQLDDAAGCFSQGQNAGLELFVLQSIRVFARNRNRFDSILTEALRDQLCRRLGQVKQRDARSRLSMDGNGGGSGTSRNRHEAQGMNSSKTPF
jgi:hypothetical protein